jgi:hypothetical protein
MIEGAPPERIWTSAPMPYALVLGMNIAGSKLAEIGRCSVLSSNVLLSYVNKLEEIYTWYISHYNTLLPIFRLSLCRRKELLLFFIQKPFFGSLLQSLATTLALRFGTSAII